MYIIWKQSLRMFGGLILMLDLMTPISYGLAEPAENDAIYYRVFNPAVWIEYNDEALRSNKPDHIHTITRSPNGNDYGIFALNHGPKTLLEHYVLADHHK